MAEHSAVNPDESGLWVPQSISYVQQKLPMFWVYVLKNPTGKFYVGQTGNLADRLSDHNKTDSVEGHFTRKNGPWELVWREAHSSRGSAMKRERQIKRMKSSEWIRRHLLGGRLA